MSAPYRNEQEAALVRAERLARENARLHAELAEARAPRDPSAGRRKHIIVLGVLAIVAGGAVLTREAIGPARSWLEARRWARAEEHVALAWSKEQTPGNVTLRAVWGDARGVYAVGDGGTILFRDPGGRWWPEHSGTTKNLRAVGGNADANEGTTVYAVGDEGTVLRFDDPSRRWVIESSGTTENLYALYVGEWGRPVYVAGARGTLLVRSHDQIWRRRETRTAVDLHGLHRAHHGYAGYAVGDAGTILNFDDYSPFPSLSPADFHEFDPVRVHASGTTSDLFAVAGNGADIIAVGAHGTLLRTSLDGKTPWTPVQSGTTQDLVAAVAARERFELYSGTRRRFIVSADTLMAMSRMGELIALEGTRAYVTGGWIHEPARDGNYFGVGAVTQPAKRDEQVNDPLLLVGEDGRAAYGDVVGDR